MTENIIPTFHTFVPSPGFNPSDLSDEEVGVFHGWRLLNAGDKLQPGDGYWYPILNQWIDYSCRSDLFRGTGEYVHTSPWRRKL